MVLASKRSLGRKPVAWLTLAGALLAGGLTGAHAQEPAKGGRSDATTPGGATVRLYVPFAAGGGSDGAARNFATSAGRLTGQPVEVINLPADSGGAASRAVRSAPPDGRTLLLARVGSMAILPALSPRTAVPVSEFTVLALLDQSPLVCAVRAGSAITSLRELQAAIAAAPGRLRYSTAGPGTLQNLAVRQLLSLSGLAADAARPVHFDQGSRATQALLDGEVDFGCNSSRTIVPLVHANRLRALMTTAPGRLKALPQVHNAAELGLRDMQPLQSWSALLGPPGMTEAAAVHWRTVLDKLADDPEWLAGTEALGAAPRIRAVRDPALFLRQQAQFYERLVTLLGLQP